MRDVRAVSFDLDGTLLDHATAVRVAFEQAWRSVDPDADPVVRSFARFTAAGARLKRDADAAGLPWWDVGDQFALAFDLPAPAARRLADGFTAALPGALERFPDARSTLDELAGRYPLALITNGDPAVQLEKLRRAGLDGYWQVIVVSGAEGVHKPDPVIFQRCAARLGVAPGHLVHVGDDPRHDVHGARAAGAQAIWVDRHATAAPPLPPLPPRVHGLDELAGVLP